MTEYYPKVARITYEDPVLKLKFDLRVAIVMLKSLHCTGMVKNLCSWRPMSRKKYAEGVGDKFTYKRVERAKMVDTPTCWYCNSSLEEKDQMVYKMYFTADKRVNLSFLQSKITYSVVHKNMLSYPSYFNWKKSPPYQYFGGKKVTYFEFFNEYEILHSMLKTAKVFAEGEEDIKKLYSKKAKITWKLIKIPTKEELWEAYKGYEKRRFIGKL